jgi:GNAT superfamily N-acetyltransferase
MDSTPLFGDYSYRLLHWDDMRPLFQQYREQVFDGISFNVEGALTEAERDAQKRLGQNLGNPYRLSIALYCREEFVGWHFGWQETSDKFYMCNTAIFPEHRNRGIYSALLPHILSILQAEGFQLVTSRHHATNNAVIVPKLKAGFTISAFEISDRHGILVHLYYYFNPIRRKAMEVRAGHERPDDVMRALFAL